MKRVFQSYKIFVPFLYRILVFLLVPLLAIGMEFLGKMIGMGLMALHAAALSLVIIVGDNWVMNGICDKRSISLDFVKSSKYGHFVMKAAVWSEACGRLILCLLLFLITGLIGKYPIASVSAGLLCFALSELGVTITRHFDNLQVMMITASIIAGLASAATSLCYTVWPESMSWQITSASAFIPMAITAGAAALTFVACGIYTIKRVEGTYYDSRS